MKCILNVHLCTEIMSDRDNSGLYSFHCNITVATLNGEIFRVFDARLFVMYSSCNGIYKSYNLTCRCLSDSYY